MREGRGVGRLSSIESSGCNIQDVAVRKQVPAWKLHLEVVWSCRDTLGTTTV